MHDRIAPEKQRLLEDLLRLCAQLRRAFPGESVPCFAHLRVAPAGLADPGQGNRGSKYRDVFLGLRTLNDPAATVLHWQTAPLSAVALTLTLCQGPVAGQTRFRLLGAPVVVSRRL